MDDGDDDDTDDDDTDDDTDDDDDDDDTDDDNDHKNDSYTAAGVAPSASVPCSLFLFLNSGSSVLVPLFFVLIILASCFQSGFWLLASGFRLRLTASGFQHDTARHEIK